jgi:hypothetical protein
VSENFSLAGWTIRTLKGKDSCIADESGRVGYYALAEDHRGDHYPYPKLPRWARFLFGCKLAWEESVDHSRHPKPRKMRGFNWGFHCSICSHRDFYTFRGSRCRICGAKYDEDGNIVHQPDWHEEVFNNQPGLDWIPF